MKTVPVTIYITQGKTGRPEGRVHPDPVTIELKDKDDVEWKLDSQYRGASADIEKKNLGDDWPFAAELPKKIKKGDPKKSGKPKDDAKHKTQYNVVCTVPNGTTPIKFVIDPDIIIIGGAS